MWQLTLAFLFNLTNSLHSFDIYHINPRTNQNLCYGVKIIDPNHWRHVSQSCRLNKKRFDLFFDSRTGLILSQKGTRYLHVSNGVLIESDAILDQTWSFIKISSLSLEFKAKNDLILNQNSVPVCVLLKIKAFDNKLVGELSHCENGDIFNSLELRIGNAIETDELEHGWTNNENELKGFSNRFKNLITRYKG